MADEMPSRSPQRDRLLTPGEVATLFRVDPKTVTRWASAGRIGSIRTPGGHRRFRESEVRALLRGDAADVTVPAQPGGSGPHTVTNAVDLNARRLAR
jgi:excisionase family DNA binding protein